MGLPRDILQGALKSAEEAVNVFDAGGRELRADAGLNLVQADQHLHSRLQAEDVLGLGFHHPEELSCLGQRLLFVLTLLKP